MVVVKVSKWRCVSSTKTPYASPVCTLEWWLFKFKIEIKLKSSLLWLHDISFSQDFAEFWSWVFVLTAKKNQAWPKYLRNSVAFLFRNLAWTEFYWSHKIYWSIYRYIKYIGATIFVGHPLWQIQWPLNIFQAQKQ